jgi:multimeric flavodoxin WrbA
MKALVLNGARDARDARDMTNTVAQMVTAMLQNGGWETDSVTLYEIEIADCTGCGGCALKTPGLCVLTDAANEILRMQVQSDLLVLLTPLTFGGFSSQLKGALDRVMGICLPIYRFYHGEIHHALRYPKQARLLGIGVAPARDEAAARTFDLLIKRTMLNFHSPAYASGVVYEGHDIQRECEALLSQMEAR